MDRYILMYEDFKLALFSVSPDSDTVADIIINHGFARYLPVGIQNARQLKKWINTRGIPVTRDHICDDLGSIDISPFQFMLLNNGLSLTDHYWICRQEEYFSWRDINLYTNEFKTSYSLDLQDDIKSIAGQTNFVPSASLKGDLKKKWIIDEQGIRRLVKGNYGSSCRQSLCEVLASEIHSRQQADYVPYTLIKISSNGKSIIGCECPNFTSISTEFVSAFDILGNEKKPNDVSWYEYYLEVCGQHGLDLRRFMEYQILSDFIISNTDRHLNNFGIIRETNNLQWLCAAPIFDSGNAMFYNESHVPSGRDLLKLGVTSFYNTEVKLLRCVKNRDVLDLSKLPDDEDLYSLLNKDIMIKDEVNECIVKAYQQKIRYLEDYQNGADLWDYKYIKTIK